MIFGYGKPTAAPCRYNSILVFLMYMIVTVETILNEQNCVLLVFYALQSHPAFTEYQDLLEDLEDKLSSVANEEEK